MPSDEKPPTDKEALRNLENASFEDLERDAPLPPDGDPRDPLPPVPDEASVDDETLSPPPAPPDPTPLSSSSGGREFTVEERGSFVATGQEDIPQLLQRLITLVEDLPDDIADRFNVE